MRKPVPILLTSALIVSSAFGGCIAPYFQRTILTDRAAISLVAADLDGDGKAEVDGITSTAAFMLRNDGTGKFGAATDIYSGALRGTMIAADLTGDGHIDLAFARDGALVVLPGKAGGTFDSPIESPTALKADAISVAGANLVVFDAAAAKLTVFRNNGKGVFTELQTSAIRPDAIAMAGGGLGRLALDKQHVRRFLRHERRNACRAGSSARSLTVAT